MAKVKDVANFFIEFAQQRASKEAGDLMTNLRLQKLLYLSQGWSLARYNKPLFDAPLEAWQFGPVVPEIYHYYKGNGKQGIQSNVHVSSSAFTPEEYDLLIDVASEYENCSTGYLVELSHDPEGPWNKVYEGQKATRIPQEDIKSYFSRKEPLPSLDELLDNLPVEFA